METMNLDNLANSLPTAAMAAFEADLQANFRAAAVSVAALYKSSRRTSKRAYNAGYAAACQDLLLMIQQGVSAGDTNDASGRGRTIERIMDYVEARLEAIKAREEEEDEDDEKEKDKRPVSGVTSRTTGSTKPPVPSVSAVLRTRDNVSAAPLTPSTPSNFASAPLPVRQASPSPLPQTTLRSLPPSSTLQRQSRSRLLQLATPNPKEAVLSNNATTFAFPTAATLSASTMSDNPVAIIPPPSFPQPSSIMPDVVPETAGTKRRHAAMIMDSSPSPNLPPTPTSSRRRTRTLRSNASGPSRDRDPPLSPQDQNQTQSADVMDIEEEGGRERKRVARR